MSVSLLSDASCEECSSEHGHAPSFLNKNDQHDASIFSFRSFDPKDVSSINIQLAKVSSILHDKCYSKEEVIRLACEYLTFASAQSKLDLVDNFASFLNDGYSIESERDRPFKRNDPSDPSSDPADPADPQLVHAESDVMVEVESPKRLSESMIWNLQRTFYENRGAEAWTDNLVPNYITSNSYTAIVYAQIVASYIRDICCSRGTLRKPVTVIELGAGIGKFGFLLLQKLSEMEDVLPRISNDGNGHETSDSFPVRLIVSDFAEINVQYCLSHPSYKPFIENGWVDFVVLDVENLDAMHTLKLSGQQLFDVAGEAVVVVANYVFDSLRHEAFRCFENKLQVGRVAVKVPQDLADSDFSSGLPQQTHFDWTFSNFEIDRVDAHCPIETNLSDSTAKTYPSPQQCIPTSTSDRSLNQFIQRYAQSLDPSLSHVFLLPVGGFGCIERFLKRFGGSTLWIVGDKGHIVPEEFVSTDDPYLAYHQGALSANVNFHGLSYYVDEVGGVALHPQGYQSGDLKIGVFAFGQPVGQLDNTRAVIQSCLRFMPDDFLILQQSIDVSDLSTDSATPAQVHTMFELALSVLRLSSYDFEMFHKLRNVLVGPGRDMLKADMRSRVANELNKVWNNFYPTTNNHHSTFFSLKQLYLHGMRIYDSETETEAEPPVG